HGLAQRRPHSDDRRPSTESCHDGRNRRLGIQDFLEKLMLRRLNFSQDHGELFLAFPPFPSANRRARAATQFTQKEMARGGSQWIRFFLLVFVSLAGGAFVG